MKRILMTSISMATLVCAMMTPVLFSSCSSSEDEQNTENQQPVELQIVTSINTRAVNAKWTEGDKIGVFALKGTTPDYSNMSYVTADGNGEFLPTTEDNTIMLPYDGNSYIIAAYYPYTDSAASGTYSIDVSNQDDQEAIDLLVATPVDGVSKVSPVASLEFTHKLVKIALTMKPGDGITADQLAGMKVTISGQPTTGTCDVINNGDIVATSNSAYDITLYTSYDGTTSEAILLPADTTEGMVLTFSVPDAGEYKWAVNSAAKSQSFGAGNKYKYDITINKTSLIVNASIEDWGDGNGGENGNAM
ncbi:MAG: fimbrillin family protein [Prevotella sp.]|nr:fimbrillin family protein [Prevotella sp.]